MELAEKAPSPRSAAAGAGGLDSRRLAALGLLVASVGALALAPVVLPDSYSWVEHTTSEAGAQGVPGAWLARLGFVLFGCAVAVVVVVSRSRWNVAGAIAHSVFASSMLAVAVFPTRSWTGAPYDRLADTLHSVAATAMGFCFVIGVLGVLMVRTSPTRRALDLLTIAAATGVPIAMTMWEAGAGVLQRLMFVIAYLWYAGESVDSSTITDAEPGPER